MHAIGIPKVLKSTIVHPSMNAFKPIGQFSSKFIWRLLRAKEQKFVQMVLII